MREEQCVWNNGQRVPLSSRCITISNCLTSHCLFFQIQRKVLLSSKWGNHDNGVSQRTMVNKMIVCLPKGRIMEWVILTMGPWFYCLVHVNVGQWNESHWQWSGCSLSMACDWWDNETIVLTIEQWCRHCSGLVIDDSWVIRLLSVACDCEDNRVSHNDLSDNEIVPIVFQMGQEQWGWVLGQWGGVITWWLFGYCVDPVDPMCWCCLPHVWWVLSGQVGT